jgi:hypothetical protein
MPDIETHNTRQISDFEKDQYLKALDVFDSEINRFWTRFNVALSIQLLLFAAIAYKIDVIQSYPFMAGVVTIVGFVFSVFTTVIVYLSRAIAWDMYYMVRDFETETEPFRVVEYYARHGGNRVGHTLIACSVVSLLTNVCWLLLLLYVTGMVHH